VSDTLDLLDQERERQLQAYRELHDATSPPEALGNRPWTQPVHSDALAVHIDQVAEAREQARRLGVPVEFDRVGRPVFTSAHQFRQYVKALGYVHKGY
jgi:hypothetical protein